MPRARRVWHKGERLPGRLEDGMGACLACWTVKSIGMFKSKPFRNRHGDYVARTLAYCSTCRRKMRTDFDAFITGSTESARAPERSEGRSVALPPVGGQVFVG